MKTQEQTNLTTYSKSDWLNRWIVPLIVALIAFVALSIAAFVGFGVHLLQ
jgi:hypothetical protein